MLLRHLESRFAAQILLTGSPQENELISEILNSAGTKRAFYFPSNVVQFIALARRAKLFLGGDTGPMHLAAAVGTPVVAIHGPTDPARNGPFNKADIALYNQAPVNHTRRNTNATYIQGISVESVWRPSRNAWRGSMAENYATWASRWRVTLGFVSPLPT